MDRAASRQPALLGDEADFDLLRVEIDGPVTESSYGPEFKPCVLTEHYQHLPSGIKGAQATTLAIYRALQGEKPAAIRAAVSAAYGYDLSLSVDEIRPNYRYNESCQGCVPQAITCALEAFSFEDAIRNAISIGGDSDTIAAIAGGIAEARFGVPESHLGLARFGLTDEMKMPKQACKTQGSDNLHREHLPSGSWHDHPKEEVDWFL